MNPKPSVSQKPPRPRGRPKQTNLQKLRSACAFLAMQHASGLSGGALERRYISDTAPQRLVGGVRKPDAFLRYLRGEQVPRDENSDRSPVRWALEHHTAFVETYRSPLFELLQLGDALDDLVEFTRDLEAHRGISADLISLTLRRTALATKRRLHVPLWSTPKDVVALRHIAKPDALCLILIALKANVGRAHEHQCLAVCAEWLQEWTKQVNPHEDLRELMLQTLAEHLPSCRLFLNGGCRTFTVNLSDPCFATSPEDAMREVLLRACLKSPVKRPGF